MFCNDTPATIKCLPLHYIVSHVIFEIISIIDLTFSVMFLVLSNVYRHLSCAFVLHTSDTDRRSIFRACTQLRGARIRQRVGVDGWMSIRRRSKRDGQHHHRWSGRYMKPARRVGARFHRNLRTCRLLPSAMTPSFPFFLLTRSACALYTFSAYSSSSG